MLVIGMSTWPQNWNIPKVYQAWNQIIKKTRKLWDLEESVRSKSFLKITVEYDKNTSSEFKVYLDGVFEMYQKYLSKITFNNAETIFFYIKRQQY